MENILFYLVWSGNENTKNHWNVYVYYLQHCFLLLKSNNVNDPQFKKMTDSSPTTFNLYYSRQSNYLQRRNSKNSAM